MHVMKYSEIALAVAFAVLTFAAWLVQPPAMPRTGQRAVEATVPPMIVVVITGKRMTPEEKRESLATD
jgi:hypothetical protein